MAGVKNAGELKKMTEGNPFSLLLFFSFPLMAGNLFQQLYTVVDTAIVGKVLGVDALAAVGAVDWLNWLVLGVIQGLAQGFGILMAQRFGARQEEALRKAMASSVILSVFAAVILTLAGQGAADPVLTLLKTPEEIKPISLDYLRVLFAGIPVVMAYNLAASILRSLGDGKTPLVAMVVAALTNVVLDLVLVMGTDMGVAGAALATVIAQFLSVVYCLLHIRKIQLLRLSREDFRMERELTFRLLYLGMPMAFQNIVISVGGMIVQTVVNGFGVVFIAGFTATNKLYGLLETAATSYGYAMTTYAGQNMGAGEYKRISKGMRAGTGIAMGTSLLIAALMLLFGRLILSCFITADGREGIEALSIAYHYLSIMSVCLPILYVLHVTRSCIQGMGNTMIPMVSGFAEFFMRTGAALLFTWLFGAEGIFFAEVLAWLGADLILVPGYLWVRRRVEASARPLSGKTGSAGESSRTSS